MHCQKRRILTPRLWNLPLVVAASLVCVTHPAAAQVPRAPAVRIQRDYQIGERVWPVDLNRDGMTDLVSTASATGRVQLSIGKGDGTFKAPVVSGFVGVVLATGDFNGDQRPDVVASRTTAAATEFVILRGTGTAMLGAAVSVAVLSVEFPIALSADLDGMESATWCCRVRRASLCIRATEI